jgi:hypothetical protein
VQTPVLVVLDIFFKFFVILLAVYMLCFCKKKLESLSRGDRESIN